MERTRTDAPPQVDPTDLAPFAPFDCDVTGGVKEDILDEDFIRAYFMGRWPDSEKREVPIDNAFFPRNMAKSELYPEESSVYTFPDGSTHDVACSNRFSLEGDSIECPGRFVPSTKTDSNAACVMTCPISAFTNEEYNAMWLGVVVPGFPLPLLRLALLVCHSSANLSWSSEALHPAA